MPRAVAAIFGIVGIFGTPVQRASCTMAPPPARCQSIPWWPPINIRPHDLQDRCWDFWTAAKADSTHGLTAGWLRSTPPQSSLLRPRHTQHRGQVVHPRNAPNPPLTGIRALLRRSGEGGLAMVRRWAEGSVRRSGAAGLLVHLVGALVGAVPPAISEVTPSNSLLLVST